MTFRLVTFLVLGLAVASTGRAQEAKRMDTPPPPAKTDSSPSPSLTRWQQAVALLNAAEHGSQTDRPQLQSLVAAVKADPALSEHARFVVVSRARGLASQETPGLSWTGRLAAYEQSARDMIAAYPGEAEPHEELLALANDQPDAAGNWSAWSAARNVTTTASTADDDGDGLTNGEEQALGTDPNTAATSGNLHLKVHEPQD